ncbi:helicase associated domain-containing protein [Alphaproteobacteria bacterium]|nr:helicase associated domain-containing protein [Alphaproteobacteria bacterium]
MSLDHGLWVKRIIDGKTYNTATAELIIWDSQPHTQKDLELLDDLAKRWPTDYDSETNSDAMDAISAGAGIFKSRNGDFFEVQWEYAMYVGGKSIEVTPKTPDEVRQLLEEMELFEKIEDIFGGAKEKEARVTVRMSENLRENLAGIAKKHNISLNNLIVKSLEGAIAYQNRRDWDTSYKLLREFVNREGHSKVPKNHIEKGYDLAAWVEEQKVAALTNEKIKKLIDIGIEWDESEDVEWERNFQLLKLAREEKNLEDAQIAKYLKNARGLPLVGPLPSGPPPNYRGLSTRRSDDVDLKLRNSKLFNWFQRQRQQRQNLTKNQIKRLDEIGYAWDPITERWEEGLRWLTKFYNLYGHTEVPVKYRQDNFSLGAWVSRQRHQKWRNLLNHEQVQRLEALGFIWNISEKRWMQGFNALRKFNDREGHTLVPQSYKEDDFQLGAWVRHQRANPLKLSGKQRSLLDSLDTIKSNKENDNNQN